MRSLVTLVLLAQLFSFSSPVLFRAFACDEHDTEVAAAVAVDYINSHSLHGYKYALNVIKNVRVFPWMHKSPKQMPYLPTYGELWLLELNLLETDCHVSNPMPVANCAVRKRTQHAVKGDCDVRMLKDRGRISITARCHSTPDSAEDVVKFCPDCPLLAPLNDPAVVSAADTALLMYNSLETTLEHYMITEIARAQHTNMPPAVYVEFAIGSTNCTHHANEHVEVKRLCAASLSQSVADRLNMPPIDYVDFTIGSTNCTHHSNEHVDDNCHLETGNHSHAGFCKATVFKTLNESGEVQCEIYKEAGHSRSHKHLAGHHIGGNRPSPGHGHTVLNLFHSHNDTFASHTSRESEERVVEEHIGGNRPSPGHRINMFNLTHSHNDTLASHESHESAERVVPAVLPAVVKRAAVEVASLKRTAAASPFPLKPLKLCPGRTRHFTL
ncbi:antihemorrhagic factor cHLP-B-like [Hemicordylus capensis]|uniref:antihemorrhagic factor cHLP-B-like n=1 Tax=Hemicordylus capensis TaxID=884348 RepID=UPI0023038349|nr:antihemorrhagic factor cHLP-B-like [Hemicordylus capensis]